MNQTRQPEFTLSVVIPVYNEEKTAALVVDQVRTHLTSIKFPPGSLYHRFKFHLIIVNDGSTDGTYSTLTKFKRFKNVTLLSSSTNRGKGFALRRGFHKARGTAVLIQDADLEYHPKYYQRLLQPLFTGQAQVVYGSRLSRLPLNLHTLRTIKMPLHFIANKLLSRFTNLLYSSHLTDMETGYKLISTGVLDQLHLTSDGFEIEVELTTKILRRGHQILEIPITTKPRNYLEGKKITYTDGIRAVIDLIRYRITPYSLGLIGVMLLAFIMRFWNFTHRYGLWSDQARDVFVGRIALRTLSPPLIGSFSSAGPFTFGPLWYYYSMLTAFLADSHLSYWIGSGLLSLFAIYLLIRLGRSIAGPAMGLTAGLFAAISIENIGSTLASTQHTAVFPTTTASLFFIHRYLKSHRALHLFLASLFYGCALNLHYQALYLLPLFLLLVLFHRPSLQSLTLFLMGIIIPFLPMAIFDLQHHSWNLTHLYRYFTVDQYQTFVPNRWLTYAGVFWPNYWARVVGGFPWLAIFQAVALIILITRDFFSTKLSKTLALYAFGFLLAFIWFRYFTAERTYGYLVFAQPFIFLFAGWLFHRLQQIDRILAFSFLFIALFGSYTRIFARVGETNIRTTLDQFVHQLTSQPLPDQIAVYDFSFLTTGCSLPLSLLLDDQGRSSDLGAKIGACEPGICPSGLPIITTGITGNFTCQLVDLSQFASTTLEGAGWVLLTPAATHNITVDWWKTEPLLR